jgi:putative transposase
VWAADFKGEFRLATGAWCYPLTISDLSSRYVLCVQGLPSTASEPAAARFRACFAEFGLPRVLRTDNGVPFGAPAALGGLSRLAVLWIRLGIRPERIAKGRPQQNGIHERMHRTLKAETTRPPGSSPAAQQRRFDQWRHTFNTQRPHEALAGATPAARYTVSVRPWPRQLPPLDYPARAELRKVSESGTIKWQNTSIFLSTALAHEYVGLESTADDEWTIRFGPLCLGVYSRALLSFTEGLTWAPWTE